MSDFRRRKWQVKGSTNSVPAFSMAPRVSMIVATDSLGNIYFSLLQSNNDQFTFGIFIQRLVKKLDEDRPNWRRETIVLMDGAAYHTADSIYDLLQKLRLPIMVLGPYR
jgi:uncharacterized protein YcbK (DUF882 family)